MRKLFVIALIIGVLFLAGCNSNAPDVNDRQVNQNEKTIEINGFAFSLEELKINQGETVVWMNKDNVKHSIISDMGNELKSELFSTSETFSHTFNSKGTFDYHCGAHPNMKAKIIVN